MISTLLLDWYQANRRDLPWRNTKSPYKIWLSEIILQQTRVNQGIKYYYRFVEKYPTINEMADAPLDEILKHWQGLGYYTRARNMHSTAISVVNDYGGVFPKTYNELKELRGVGEYTAAAVASFAFGEPVPLVDGNVYRVIARLYDNHTPVNTSAGKKTFLQLASQLFNHEQPDIHNQAMMEFGALVCIPRTPHCSNCVLSSRCLALKNGTVSDLPVKNYRVHAKTRYFNYLYITWNNLSWIKRRKGNDIWNSLYELPLIETLSKENFGQLSRMSPWNSFIKGPSFRLLQVFEYIHKLSHQQLVCSFFSVDVNEKPVETGDYFPVYIEDLHKYAVPRVIEKFWSDISK